VSEPFEIHNSWIQTQLGEIVNYGKTDKAEPTEIPSDTWVLELEDIEKDICPTSIKKHKKSI
jgi:type I restriction enzyme, S subunit